MERVGAGLRHHVDITGIGAAHFGRGAVSNHLELAYRNLREEIFGLIGAAAALAALQRIAEIHAIERDIHPMGALAVDHNAEAILLLHGVGRQLHELREVPPESGDPQWRVHSALCHWNVRLIHHQALSDGNLRARPRPAR